VIISFETQNGRRRPWWAAAVGVAWLLPLWAAACAFEGASDGAPVVAERWVSEGYAADNIDSPTIWRGANGEAWAIVTAKATDRLVVLDASTGAFVRGVGGPSDPSVTFRRPNGIAAVDSMLFVVERDNRRVQVLALPSFRPLGSFGAEGLREPYGLWVRPLGEGRYTVYVTDTYGDTDDPADADERTVQGTPETLAKRVHRFVIRVDSAHVTTDSARTFGESAGEGVLHIVESLWGDTASGHLLIADEDRQVGRALRLYDLEGTFQGRSVGAGQFTYQAEGIALDARPDGSGYWIATDQDPRINRFHLFDRVTLAHVGTFGGKVTRNTDGIWFDPTPAPGRPRGTLYAIHDDQGIAAFDWAEVLTALGLR
jgi:3-phytase